MDELLKSITALINTGGALADDALYLYFLLKVSQGLSFSLFAWVVLRGIREIVRTSLNLSARNNYLRVLAGWAGSAEKYHHYMEEAKQAFESR